MHTLVSVLWCILCFKRIPFKYISQSEAKIVSIKPVLSGHSKIIQKLFYKNDYCIMQAKSIAEFCNTFDLHLASICLCDLCFVYL